MNCCRILHKLLQEIEYYYKLMILYRKLYFYKHTKCLFYYSTRKVANIFNSYLETNLNPYLKIFKIENILSFFTYYINKDIVRTLFT